VLFITFTLAVSILGAYWFGGKPIPLLLSAQMFWVLWWGQLEGWAILALVFGWIGMTRQSWTWTFFALALGAFKPQVGFIPVLFLWAFSGRDKWKAAGLLAVVFVLTLIIWGPWPVWYLQGMLASRFVESHADTVRASLGAIALPLFLPALLFPLSRYQRLLALAATAQLVSPYLPYYSTVILWVFDLPWLFVPLAFLGYFPAQIGATLAWQGYVIFPALILAWLYWPIARAWWQNRVKT
jgi:hypothetical protein